MVKESKAVSKQQIEQLEMQIEVLSQQRDQFENRVICEKSKVEGLEINLERAIADVRTLNVKVHELESKLAAQSIELQRRQEVIDSLQSLIDDAKKNLSEIPSKARFTDVTEISSKQK